MAGLLIDEGLDLLAGVIGDNPDSYAARRELTRALIRARIVGFELERSEVSSPALDLADRRPEAMSCDEVSLAMQDAVIAGKREQAGVFAGYLRKKGYWHPGLIRFCQAHEGCGDYALGLL